MCIRDRPSGAPGDKPAEPGWPRCHCRKSDQSAIGSAGHAFRRPSRAPSHRICHAGSIRPQKRNTSDPLGQLHPGAQGSRGVRRLISSFWPSRSILMTNGVPSAVSISRNDSKSSVEHGTPLISDVYKRQHIGSDRNGIKIHVFQKCTGIHGGGISNITSLGIGYRKNSGVFRLHILYRSLHGHPPC